MSKKIGISIKLDVTKIDKARLFNGAKGTYLDLTTFVDLGAEDQYGNHGFISQSVSKEEREAGVKTAILGNCKVFYGGQSVAAPTPPAAFDASDSFDDDIPFS